jgi:cytochrome c oxidase assembly protein subunit 11
VKDAEGQFVKEITLSYTFYQTALPEEQAALDAATGEAVN